MATDVLTSRPAPQAAAETACDSVNAIALDELREREPGLRLLDVRTPGEFEATRICGSYNVPLDQVARYAETLGDCDHTSIVVVCQSGARARQAQATLQARGVRNVQLLDGGVNAWIAAGKPVERSAERLSLERQVRIAAGAMAAIGAILALTLNPWFALLPAFVGSGLVFAGVTNTCALAMVLSKLPYNRPRLGCDVDQMVQAFRNGDDPEALLNRTDARAPAARNCSC